MNFNNYQKNSFPTIIKTAALILAGFASTSSFAQQNTRAKTNIGLVYPLSSNGAGAARDTNSFSLNIIAGVSAAERGFTIAGITNIIHNNATGFQIAGFSNHVGHNADGTMVAGFLNTYGSGKGVAIAGFANIANTGSGPQIAGFLNKGGDVSSLQIAGFSNVAKNVKGVQISAFINVAKKVKGTQLSFINIADSAGTQIGIINLSKNGEKAFAATIDENQTTLLTFRSGGKTLYGIIGVGYNFKNKRDRYAYEAGLGAHIFSTKVFRLNTELVSGGLESFKGGDYFKSSFRLMPAFKITRTLELFGGPSINYVNADTEEGRNMTTKYISSWKRNNDRNLYGFYAGYTAGVQVLF
ncbi:hypothetical protein SAMN05216464_10116 [Mucilaginibacter pineti]|uniref:Uncharacterized protein n=1 Tax=Mucilaginibacter pineti TaxID=1391627 RepID=A0A1G6SR22_9SPHI|nr:hypothetical protein [Mucilaginibacter pineti]SDD19283.1 hypothetical protein SAMN05216464_10116 [Mucilaginibacter pineti]